METKPAAGLQQRPAAGREGAPVTAGNELTQEDFFTLMVAQLRNQDPSKPLDGQQYLGQLAQFSAVSGLQELQAAVDRLAGPLQSAQALQASALVGREVLTDAGTADAGAADAGTAYLAEQGTVDGRVALDAAADDLTLVVSDAAGQELRRISLGRRPAGAVEFAWDGLLEGGERAVPGVYGFSLEGSVGGELRRFRPQLRATVESVAIDHDSGRVTLQLRGLGALDFGDVNGIF